MNCTRCDGTGFLNLDQVGKETLSLFDAEGDVDVILKWIAERAQVQANGCFCAATRPPCSYCESFHDVSVCDCCGNGEEWYGEPGRHDLSDTTVPFPQCY